MTTSEIWRNGIGFACGEDGGGHSWSLNLTEGTWTLLRIVAAERQMACPENNPTSHDSSIQTMPLAQATCPDPPSRYRIALPSSTLLPQDPDLGLHARLHPPPSSQVSPRILVDPLLRLYLSVLPLDFPEISD